MKYEKPQLRITEYALDKPIAAGMEGWLTDAGFNSAAADHISTYEVDAFGSNS